MAPWFWHLPDPGVSMQAEVCSGTVADVLQCVVGGADGCIFSFGHTSLGKHFPHPSHPRYTLLHPPPCLAMPSLSLALGG
jgi:hypothetical protein